MTDQLQGHPSPFVVPEPAPATAPAPVGPALAVVQRPPRNPLRGWLIAILACLVFSLVVQAVTLMLLVPRLVSAPVTTKTVTLVALSTGAEASVAINAGTSSRVETIADGATFKVPVLVGSGATVAIQIAANESLNGGARITCEVTDEAGAQLVYTSSVVHDSPTVTCTWTNNG